MRSGSALVTDTIGGRSPRTEMPRRRATRVPAAPISWARASSRTSSAPPARRASTASTPWEWPATATGGVAARSMPWRARARMAAIWVSSTPGTDTAAEVSCLADGTASSAASRRTQRSGSKPMGRTTTSSLATGSSSSSASPASVASSDSIPAEVTSSSRVSSHALPCPPKATAYGSPALRRSTSAWVVLCGASPRSEPRPDPSPVDSLSCSWIVTLSNSLDTSRRVVCRLHSDLRCPGGGVRRFLSRITDGPGGPVLEPMRSGASLAEKGPGG